MSEKKGPRQCECVTSKGKRCKSATITRDVPFCGKHKKNCIKYTGPEEEDLIEKMKNTSISERKTPDVKQQTVIQRPQTVIQRPQTVIEQKSEVQALPAESKSPRGKSPVSPTSKSSRREKGQYKEDVSSRSSRRYLLPARIPGFKSFLCNMLEYKAPDTLPELKYYPIGYISYLLRAYSYDTTSITPINVSDDSTLKPLLNQGIEIKDAFSKTEGREFRAYYLKDTPNSIIIPATLVYSNPPCVYMKNDLFSLISQASQRQIVIFAKEIWQNKDSYLAIFIDQKEDRKTIDIIPEFRDRAGAGAGAVPMEIVGASESGMASLAGAGAGASELSAERKRLLDDLFNSTGYTIRYHDQFGQGNINPRVWQIMLIHLKLINKPYDSFDALQSELIKEIGAGNVKSIVYSYYMKILRLSTNQNTDYELLSVFHGSD